MTGRTLAVVSDDGTVNLLRDELQQNGIAALVPELVEYEVVLGELNHALRPIVHEGKVQPYGFMVCNCAESPIHQTLSQDLTFELDIARKLSDGCHSFLVFTQGCFRGIFTLDERAGDEMRLVQLQQSLQAIICITDITGTTKIFCDAGVFIHQYRRWQQKPAIKQALQNISRCIDPVDCRILHDILAFCFYELSPQKIGATLVWCLKSLDSCVLERLLPNTSVSNLEKIKVNISKPISRAILRHVLTYTDGAVLLNQDGMIMGSSVHLKYSDNSRRYISAYHGTRHTSAKRFSFDFPETVLFVVSSDGLVTVFSDGMNVVNLKTYSANDAESERANVAESSQRDEMVTQEQKLTCPTCKKSFKIRTNGLAATTPIRCLVCNSPLDTIHHRLIDIHIFKDCLLQ